MIKFTNNEKYKDNPILKLSFELAVLCVKYLEELDSSRKYSIANQISRSGTSIGANIKEAQNAESKKDFIHKLKISSKEADELEYWFFLCNEIDSYPSSNGLLEKLEEVQRLLTSIISKTSQNMNKTYSRKRIN